MSLDQFIEQLEQVEQEFQLVPNGKKKSIYYVSNRWSMWGPLEMAYNGTDLNVRHEFLPFNHARDALGISVKDAEAIFNAAHQLVPYSKKLRKQLLNATGCVS